MGEKIVVGPFDKGLKNDVTAFNVDNAAFPVLINAYQWRGRIKRKRGTSFLARLTRFFNSASTAYIPTANATFALVAGAGNLFTGFLLAPNGNIVPGTVTITDTTTGDVYTDPGLQGILVGIPAGTGTINYATGDITITGGATDLISASFLYYPGLPVMGLEDFKVLGNTFPGNISFDTVYSYSISTSFPYPVHDVSFYKNDSTNALLPLYVPKTIWTPTTWNGQDYQQFWTVNYQGAFWATNGIPVPFVATNIAMQFAPAATITYVSNTATSITLTITNSPLVVGDFVFLNEFTSVTVGAAITLNFQSGYVITATGTPASLTVTIDLPFANVMAATYVPGIVQYLTNRSDVTKDTLRWYDGDPTNGLNNPPGFLTGQGWVNFMPPLTVSDYSIGDLPPAQYYLVGARMIVPFKDRLLFIGVVLQTSALNSQVYLQDTVVYSQNGTPYYTASFTGDPGFATTTFTPINVPINQTATAPAYWEDQTGFGGFITAGIDQPISTAGNVDDVLIIGFETIQAKIIYSGDDLLPFNFYIVNSELGSNSTFSIINMDKGVITRGDRGIIATAQTNAARIDLDIPDEVFEIRLLDNGNERVTAQRDFISEWVYITYPVNDDSVPNKFPNQTLQYNYRHGSWAIFRESYTHYGQFKKQTGFTWATVGTVFPTWAEWNEPWNAGASSLLEPKVIAGNQQGFVMEREDGTGEGTSLSIQSFTGSLVTSLNHGLNEGDYIIITGAIGTVGQQVNGKIFSVALPTTNGFMLNPSINTNTYLGGGLITRMYIPFIQTKQFPVAWAQARKTRLGVQQYLFTATPNQQITLQIYLSQDADNAYNDLDFPYPAQIIPQASQNNTLVYNTTLYTCPESTNLGLTPANVNLNMITALYQKQIWHRMNTSLIGDTVQIGFTMNDTQMRSLDPIGSPILITGITQANPAVLTANNAIGTDIILQPGQLIQIVSVGGMTQINFTGLNTYIILSSTLTSITIQVDSTGFSAYTAGGNALPVGPLNQFAEIELHGFILDVTPSGVLA